MKYVIMCGGKYEQWHTPKQLNVVNGETLVGRTIRLLRENHCNEVYITSNDSRFDGLGVERLEHHNSYCFEDGKLKGYWLDAFYPHFKEGTQVTFLFGDVYFTENAIKKIIDCPKVGNILYGSKGATVVGKLWGEPFAYVVNDIKTFYAGVAAVKRLQDQGKTNRVPIVWELYRYLNGIDVNTHRVLPSTYRVIEDGTNDCDSYNKLMTLKDRFDMKGNVFTVINLNSIGGGESFLYYVAKKYKDTDITIYYTKADYRQLERLKKYAKLVHYTGQKIKCKRVFFNFNQAYKKNIQAEEYYQVIHIDYMAHQLKIKSDNRMKYIAVSELAAKNFEKHTGKKCEVCYNPIEVDTDRPLILMSASRLSEAKGKNRIAKLANLLDKQGIKYKWMIFTNDTKAINNNNILYLPPTLDVVSYMPIADWFVQLSDDEGYCYAVVEALMMGTPAIVTPCPVFKEIGLDATNSITLDFGLSNIPYDKIKEGIKDFKYTPPEDRWGEILAQVPSSVVAPQPDTFTEVETIRPFDDVISGHARKKGDVFIAPLRRARDLVNKKVVKYI